MKDLIIHDCLRTGKRRAIITAFALAMLGGASAASAGGDEPEGAEAAVTRRVAQEVGRPVDAAFTVVNRSGPWTFLCGRPVERDGSPFDVERSALAPSEFGADFCALVQTAGGDARVVEFDIGSTDMPAMDSIERHHLPAGLLSGG